MYSKTSGRSLPFHKSFQRFLVLRLIAVRVSYEIFSDAVQQNRFPVRVELNGTILPNLHAESFGCHASSSLNRSLIRRFLLLRQRGMERVLYPGRKVEGNIPLCDPSYFRVESDIVTLENRKTARRQEIQLRPSSRFSQCPCEVLPLAGEPGKRSSAPKLCG